MVNEYTDFESMKHKNAKELLSVKEKMNDNQFKRKMSFTSFLYDLKNKFLDKEETYKRERITLVLAKNKKLLNKNN